MASVLVPHQIRMAGRGIAGHPLSPAQVSRLLSRHSYEIGKRAVKELADKRAALSVVADVDKFCADLDAFVKANPLLNLPKS